MDLQASFEVTAGVSGQAQLDALNSSLKGTAVGQRAVQDAGSAMLTSLRDQIAALSGDQAALMQYQAALLGVSEQAGPLIAQLEAAKRATQDKARADAEATRNARQLAAEERQAASARDRFVQSLQDQVATQGKTAGQILEYRAAQLGVTKEAAPLIAQLKAAEGQMSKTGVSAGQMNAAMAQLPMQMQDVIVSLQGGQAPLTVLLQQGSQVAGSFGGVGNAFAAVGRYALGLINPLTIIAGTVAVLTGISVAGAMEQAAFRDSLLLTGNAAGMTQGRFEELAAGIQQSSGVTASTARDIAAAAVASGAFGAQSIGQVTQAMGSLQKLSGQATDAVVKDFASMRNGVASWAAEHNKQYNFLTAAQYSYIAALERQGQTQKAMEETARLFSAAMAERLAQREGQLGTLEKAWEGVKKAASEAWQAMLNIGRDKTLEQQIAETEKEIADLQQLIAKGGRKGLLGGSLGGTEDAELELAGLQGALAKLLKAKREADTKATESAKSAAAEQAAIQRETSGQAEREANAALAVELQRAQNRSAARVALLEQEKARVEGLHRMQVTDEATYAAQKLAVDQRILAEKSKLIDQEIAIEKRRPVLKGDAAAADTQAQKLLALEAQKAALASQRVIAGINAKFEAPPKLAEWQQALADMGGQVAKLKAQADGIGQFGDKVSSATEASMRFEVEQGKFRTLTQQQKDTLLAAARAVDTYTAALDTTKAGFSYDRATKEIERQTAALGQNALQRKVNADLQELENAGIKKGTALYERLAAERRAALVASEAAAKSWETGVAQGVQEITNTISDNAAMAKGLLTDIFKGAEDALVSFVTTGKADFKSFANSILADIARIQIRKMLSNSIGSDSGWISSIISAGAALFGVSTGAGAISGGSGITLDGVSAGSSAGSSMYSLTGRASGGRVEPYATYKVNETGTETLTMGGQGGYILNAKQTRAAQGDQAGPSKSTVVHFNQTNTIGSAVSRSEVAAALAHAKEVGKAEMLDMLRRHGSLA